MYVCKLPKDEQAARKMNISNVTRKICKYIDIKEEIDLENNKEEIEQEEKQNKSTQLKID